VTNKIHEALLDLAYNSAIGDEPVATEVLWMIDKHNEAGIPNHKGLLAQLALLYKLINSFEIKSSGVITVDSILDAVIPALSCHKEDVRNAAIKILVDTQKQTGQLIESDFGPLQEKIRL